MDNSDTIQRSSGAACNRMIHNFSFANNACFMHINILYFYKAYIQNQGYHKMST